MNGRMRIVGQSVVSSAASFFALIAYLHLHGPAWAWWGGGAAQLLVMGLQFWRVRHVPA